MRFNIAGVGLCVFIKTMVVVSHNNSMENKSTNCSKSMKYSVQVVSKKEGKKACGMSQRKDPKSLSC